jgi:hypothetical protein
MTILLLFILSVKQQPDCARERGEAKKQGPLKYFPKCVTPLYVETILGNEKTMC